MIHFMFFCDFHTFSYYYQHFLTFLCHSRRNVSKRRKRKTKCLYTRFPQFLRFTLPSLPDRRDKECPQKNHHNLYVCSLILDICIIITTFPKPVLAFFFFYHLILYRLNQCSLNSGPQTACHSNVKSSNVTDEIFKNVSNIVLYYNLLLNRKQRLSCQ